MFFDAPSLIASVDHHRDDLLADADNFRLAKLARTTLRRAAKGAADPPRRPRRSERSDHGDPGQRDAGQRNDEASRRYAVSR